MNESFLITELVIGFYLIKFIHDLDLIPISFNAPALTFVEGDFNVSCPGEVKMDKLTNIAGNFNVSAPKIGAANIQSITGDVAAVSLDISMPNLTTVGGNLSV